MKNHKEILLAMAEYVAATDTDTPYDIVQYSLDNINWVTCIQYPDFNRNDWYFRLAPKKLNILGVELTPPMQISEIKQNEQYFFLDTAKVNGVNSNVFDNSVYDIHLISNNLCRKNAFEIMSMHQAILRLINPFNYER